jgi:hypothetical protein
LFFYELNLESNQFTEEKKIEKGYFIACHPMQLHWDEDLIYYASNKAYIILNKNTGSILQNIPHEKLTMPMITLSKNKCMILSGGNRGYFLDEQQGIKKNIKLRFSQDK